MSWFQKSFALFTLTNNDTDSTFGDLLAHGFVLDEHGFKLSKSKANGIAPQKIIDEYGADTLRLGLLGMDYTKDIHVGPESFKAAAETHRRIRNTLRYLVGALKGYDRTAEHADEPEIEFRARFNHHNFIDRMETALGQMNFAEYIRHLNAYCVDDLSSFLFDIRKDRLYCDALDDPKRNAYLRCLDTIFEWLIFYAAPVMPHTAEEIMLEYDPTRRACDLTMPHWSDPNFPEELQQAWDKLLEVRDEVNRDLEEARKAKVIKDSLETVVGLLKPPAPLHVCQEVFKVSRVEPILGGEGFAEMMVMLASEQGLEKCQRCWRYDVIPQNGDICDRCYNVIADQ